MNKWLFTAIILAVVIGLICIFSQEEPKHQVDGISTVTVSDYSFGIVMSEYLFDFENEKYYSYRAGVDNTGVHERDMNNGMNGFNAVYDFDEENYPAFKSGLHKYRFLNWEGNFINYEVMDGHQWSIIITLKDDTVIEVHGSNAYPKNYQNIMNIFNQFVGDEFMHFLEFE